MTPEPFEMSMVRVNHIAPLARRALTKLGEEFVRGVEKAFVLEGFPRPGSSVEIQWSQSLQNFVITKTVP